MRICSCLLATCGMALLAGPAQAQTVQLPSFSFSTVNTTVSVPDRGSALVGGINRASSGSTSRGVPIVGKVPGLNRLFNNRGIGSARSASQFRVNATIIDLHEMDQQILGGSPGSLVGGERVGAIRRDPLRERADFITRNVARVRRFETPRDEPPPAARPTADDLRQQAVAIEDARAAEARNYFARGQRAEAEGKRGAAKVYYHMALRRAGGEFKSLVAGRLEALSTGGAAKIASRK